VRMRQMKRIIAAWMVLCAAVSAGQAGNATKRGHAKDNAQAGQGGAEDRGQQVFNQNCSRCHQAPEGFSPSVSGTIARHMRVRANLSEEDYKALLKFFNP
jgi:cytochrome c5